MELGEHIILSFFFHCSFLFFYSFILFFLSFLRIEIFEKFHWKKKKNLFSGDNGVFTPHS